MELGIKIFIPKNRRGFWTTLRLIKFGVFVSQKRKTKFSNSENDVLQVEERNY